MSHISRVCQSLISGVTYIGQSDQWSQHIEKIRVNMKFITKLLLLTLSLRLRYRNMSSDHQYLYFDTADFEDWNEADFTGTGSIFTRTIPEARKLRKQKFLGKYKVKHAIILLQCCSESLFKRTREDADATEEHTSAPFSTDQIGSYGNISSERPTAHPPPSPSPKRKYKSISDLREQSVKPLQLFPFSSGSDSEREDVTGESSEDDESEVVSGVDV
ncbi:hypothetical protein G9A89_000925 [Geosiphon pyriformis]|nr:hypothetical protein G9A89_000925 [Geosiphon pyriformis]